MSVQSDFNLETQTRTYTVAGQVFFASSERFVTAFDFAETVRSVIIDVQHAHFWDITAVAALDKVVLKWRKQGTLVEVIGLDAASTTLVDRFAQHPNAVPDKDTLLHE